MDLKIELYLYQGSLDWDNSLVQEDRYIIVDNGIDLYGEHFSLTEAQELIKL